MHKVVDAMFEPATSTQADQGAEPAKSIPAALRALQATLSSREDGQAAAAGQGAHVVYPYEDEQAAAAGQGAHANDVELQATAASKQLAADYEDEDDDELLPDDDDDDQAKQGL